MAGESRRYFEAAQFLVSAGQSDGSRKDGKPDRVRIRCRLRAAVANSVYLGLYHSAPTYVQGAPAYIPESLSEIVEIKALRLPILVVRYHQVGNGLRGDNARFADLFALGFALKLIRPLLLARAFFLTLGKRRARACSHAH